MEELFGLMGQIYDKKYKNLKFDNDVRGHDDKWSEIFYNILDQIY